MNGGAFHHRNRSHGSRAFATAAVACLLWADLSAGQGVGTQQGGLLAFEELLAGAAPSIVWDWQGNLYEAFSYAHLRTNVGLTEPDFTVR